MDINAPWALKENSLLLTSYSTMKHYAAEEVGPASILVLTGKSAELFSFPMMQCDQAQISTLSHTSSTARLKGQQEEGWA